MLHSTFWYNSACDLNIPIWWNPLSLTANITAAGHVSQQSDTLPAGNLRDRLQASIVLDFLYPAKTLALMQKLSASYKQTWRRLNAHKKSRSVRQFSSTRRKNAKPYEDTSDILGLSRIDAKSTVTQEQARDPHKALDALIKSRGQANQEIGWQLYRRITPSDRSDVAADFLDFLGQSTRIDDAGHVLEVFEAIPYHSRRPSSYKFYITALLTLGLPGKAINVHTEALRRSFSDDFGTSTLLYHLISHRQWNLAAHFWAENTSHNNKDGMQQALNDCPELVESSILLLNYLMVDRTGKENIQHINEEASQFLKAVLNVAVQQISGSHSETCEVLFNLLRASGQIKLSYYEMALESLCSKRNQGRRDRADVRLAVGIYSDYVHHIRKTHRPDLLRPSQSILRKLILGLKDHNDLNLLEKSGSKLVTISTLLQDWKYFYGEIPPDVCLVALNFFAYNGKSSEVMSYFTEMQACFERNKQPIQELKYVSCLIRVFAKQAKPKEAYEQFMRVQNEFGLIPDTLCWNFLIQAHVLASDIDGAFQRLDELLEAGCKPNAQTFDHLLYLQSQTGDVDAVEDLIAWAEEYNPSISKVKLLYWRLVVSINSGNIDRAEAFADMMLSNRESSPTARKAKSKAWSTILTAFAMKGDLSSLLRVYNRMGEEKIELTASTYAALMRGFAVARQTVKAWAILKWLNDQKTKVVTTPFHYAIVMSGFIKEGNPRQATNVFQDMKARGLPTTLSTRVALMHATARSHDRDSHRESSNSNHCTLHGAETSLKHIMDEFDASEVAEGAKTYFGHATRQQAVAEAYASRLISLYSTSESYDVLKRQFAELLEGNHWKMEQFDVPLRALTQLMRAHHANRQTEAVEMCWVLALTQAEHIASKNISRTLEQPGANINTSTHTATTKVTSSTGSAVDVNEKAGEKHLEGSGFHYTDVKEENHELGAAARVPSATAGIVSKDASSQTTRYMSGNTHTVDRVEHAWTTYRRGTRQRSEVAETNVNRENCVAEDRNKVAIMRRRIITEPLNIYVQHLVQLQEYDRVCRDLNELRKKGYELDNRLWNTYAEVLARSGRIVEAVELCERCFMPTWRGWRARTAPHHHVMFSGFEYMKVSKAESQRRWEPRIKYRTMVILAAAIVHTRSANATKQERKGLNMLNGKDLRIIAPKTLEAVDSMPLVRNDQLQQEFLRS
jgi:pentatricopeptide repeat-containing protein PET309